MNSEAQYIQKVLPLIRYYAKNLLQNTFAVDVEDLVSEGLIGALLAYRHYDPARCNCVVGYGIRVARWRMGHQKGKELLYLYRFLSMGPVAPHWDFTPSLIEFLSPELKPLKAQETHFTQQQIEVIKGVWDDLKDREIAERMHLSERTVAFHIRNALKISGKKSRVGLCREAIERGLM